MLIPTVGSQRFAAVAALCGWLALAGPLPADDADGVAGLLRNDSLYVCSQGAKRVVDEQAYDAVPVVVERLMDPRADHQIRRLMVDTLVSLNDTGAVRAAFEAAHIMFGGADRALLALPAEVGQAPQFDAAVTLLTAAVGARAETYLVSRLSKSPRLEDSSPLSAFLEPQAPPLMRAAGLLAADERRLPFEPLVDAVAKLTRDDQPVLRGLAFRWLANRLPPADAASFLAPGLTDASPLPREALLRALGQRGVPALEEALEGSTQRERDPALAVLARFALDAAQEARTSRRLWLAVEVALLLAVLGALSSIPWWIRRRRSLQFAQGLLSMERADYNLAAEMFRTVAATAPELKQRSLLHLLRALVRLNRLEEASELFEQLDAVGCPDDDLYALAVDVDGKGLKARAVAVYLTILSRRPDYLDVKQRFDAIDVKHGGGRTELPSVATSSSTSLVDVLRKMISPDYGDIALVGKGGMGSVFSAVFKKSGERVAVKVLSPDLANKEAIRTRFYRESVAIANLCHPNICKVREVKKAELPFIIMEFIDGESLKAILKRQKAPLSRRIFLALALPVTDALAYAHEKSIVHRDIKPENILVTRDGAPKVIDFGLVKFKETASDITCTGDMMGTPMYMSPEQLKGEASIDARTDIFSFGLTMYEMLTLAYPYPTTAVFQRVFLEPQRLRDKNPAVPAQVERIIMNCLADDPDERPADGAELKSLLESAAEYWTEDATTSAGTARTA